MKDLSNPTNTLNKKYGLTKIYQHNFDDKTSKCKKCHKSAKQLEGTTKLCGVIGLEEVAQFRDYDER